MNISSFTKGQSSENIATQYLINLGWNIVYKNYKAKNYSGRHGEIDIIATLESPANKTIVAFEVKSRSNKLMLDYSISKHQQLRIKNAFLYFLGKHPCYNGYDLRFDALLMLKNKNQDLKIQHITNAWLDEE